MSFYFLLDWDHTHDKHVMSEKQEQIKFMAACDMLRTCPTLNNPDSLLKRDEEFSKLGEIVDFTNKSPDDIIKAVMAYIKNNIDNKITASVAATDELVDIEMNDLVDIEMYYRWIAAYAFLNDQHSMDIMKQYLGISVSSPYARQNDFVKMYTYLIEIHVNQSCMPRSLHRVIVDARVKPWLVIFCSETPLFQRFPALEKLVLITKIYPQLFNMPFAERISAYVCSLCSMPTNSNEDIKAIMKALCICLECYFNFFPILNRVGHNGKLGSVFLHVLSYIFKNRHLLSTNMALNVQRILCTAYKILFVDVNELKCFTVATIKEVQDMFSVLCPSETFDSQHYLEIVMGTILCFSSNVPSVDAVNVQTQVYNMRAAQETIFPINPYFLQIHGKFFENLLKYPTKDNFIDMTVYDEQVVMLCICVIAMSFRSNNHAYALVRSKRILSINDYLCATNFAFNEFDRTEFQVHDVKTHVAILFSVVDMAGYIGNHKARDLVDYAIAKMIADENTQREQHSFSTEVCKYIVNSHAVYDRNIPLTLVAINEFLFRCGRRIIWECVDENNVDKFSQLMNLLNK